MSFQGHLRPQALHGHWLAFCSGDSWGLAFQNIREAKACLGWIHASLSPGKGEMIGNHLCMAVGHGWDLGVPETSK